MRPSITRLTCAHAAPWISALLLLGCTKDEPIGPEWVKLVEANWTLQAGTEGYTCARTTIKEDVWVRAYRPIAPLGTHHTLLTLDPNPESEVPDSVFECTAGFNGQNMLFGSGVGTKPIEFPPGVAMKLVKGQHLILNLHLFNVGNQPLSGLSGMEVERVDPNAVTHEAESVLAGKIGGLRVDPGKSLQTGSCPISHESTVFAVFPHMHQLGTHLKATAVPANGTPRVIHDGPYSFEEQRYYALSPDLKLAAGDQVTVDCEYQNPGAEAVYFGDSSTAEMCFIGLFRYPRIDEGFICSDLGDAGGFVLDGPPCAKPGAPGNEKGVGKECTAGGGECAGNVATICLKDLPFLTGDFGNFCTATCTNDAECGSEARCSGSSGQKACIPSGCELRSADAGASL